MNINRLVSFTVACVAATATVSACTPQIDPPNGYDKFGIYADSGIPYVEYAEFLYGMGAENLQFAKPGMGTAVGTLGTRCAVDLTREENINPFLLTVQVISRFDDSVDSTGHGLSRDQAIAMLNELQGQCA